MPASQGDPAGRRLARRRAAHLAEAGRVARALDVLLQRAAFDTVLCEQLSREIAGQELIELQRAEGRIEPRSRFKPRVGHPLLENRSPSLLFIDECGTPHFQSHAAQPVFSLAAVALAEEHVLEYRMSADALKQRFFGTSDLTFHEPDIRQLQRPYYFEGDRARLAEFDAAVDELVANTPFTLFGAAIRKRAFEQEFVAAGLDPYLPMDVYSLAILMLLERYVDYLATNPIRCMGRVTFESQGPREDALHQLENARVLVDETQWVPESAFRSWLEPGLRFTPKSGSDPMGCGGLPGSAQALGAVQQEDLLPRRWSDGKVRS